MKKEAHNGPHYNEELHYVERAYMGSNQCRGPDKKQQLNKKSCILSHERIFIDVVRQVNRMRLAGKNVSTIVIGTDLSGQAKTKMVSTLRDKLIDHYLI